MSNKAPPSFRNFYAGQQRKRGTAPKARVQYLRDGQSGLSSITGTRAQPGRVAKRYVATVQPLTLDAIRETIATDVLVAVRRDAGGVGHIALASVRPLTLGLARGFLQAAEQAGATELHVHRLCKTVAEAGAAADDLAPVAAQSEQAA